MINRFNVPLFRGITIAPSLRPQVHEPNMDRKTRADIRREIFEKLALRMQNLGLSGQ